MRLYLAVITDQDPNSSPLIMYNGGLTSSFFLLLLATRTGPHQLVPLQPPYVHGRAGAGEYVEALWSGHIHTHPERLQRRQQRSGLCQVSALSVNNAK